MGTYIIYDASILGFVWWDGIRIGVTRLSALVSLFGVVVSIAQKKKGALVLWYVYVDQHTQQQSRSAIYMQKHK